MFLMGKTKTAFLDARVKVPYTHPTTTDYRQEHNEGNKFCDWPEGKKLFSLR